LACELSDVAQVAVAATEYADNQLRELESNGSSNSPTERQVEYVEKCRSVPPITRLRYATHH
ncbi:MAG: hypothetical protein QOK46_622, partial [Microbacteriaceae bacterium]|nr:hypothetical protein [Microbacteriaceae bacterium]